MSAINPVKSIGYTPLLALERFIRAGLLIRREAFWASQVIDFRSIASPELSKKLKNSPAQSPTRIPTENPARKRASKAKETNPC